VRKLIEGRRPNLFVSAKIAAATGEKASYIKRRAFGSETGSQNSSKMDYSPERKVE